MRVFLRPKEGNNISFENDSDFKKYSLCLIPFVVFAIAEALQVAGYVFENPAHLPLFILVFVFVPIVSLIAFWHVGYRNRPINSPSNQSLS